MVVRKFENFNGLYGWVARLVTKPYKPLKFFELSDVHKISQLSYRVFKIGNLTNFVMLFPFLATILYCHLFLGLTWSDLVKCPFPAKRLLCSVCIVYIYQGHPTRINSKKLRMQFCAFS